MSGTLHSILCIMNWQLAYAAFCLDLLPRNSYLVVRIRIFLLQNKARQFLFTSFNPNIPIGVKGKTEKRENALQKISLYNTKGHLSQGIFTVYFKLW